MLLKNLDVNVTVLVKFQWFDAYKLYEMLVFSQLKQSYAEGYTEQIEAASGEDRYWRTGRLQNRKKHHRADLKLKNPLWEISPAPAI